MGKTVVLDGELGLALIRDGEMNLLTPEDGELGTVMVVHDGGDVPLYTGEYVVDPDFERQVLPTTGKRMYDDVTVNAIEVARTTNPAGGTTVYIGGIINDG